MAAKKSSNNVSKSTMNIFWMLAIGVGIFLVITGILSTDVDSWRALIMAVGMASFAGGIIGYK